ncbi:hypothetical protein Q9V76_004458 [Salmonella enterica]|nr:hypothetical protein [Salmonella enterica subsp. enterica serovar Ona]ELH5812061.1 hypothetical protein [Salmonella enterica]
MKTAKIKVYQHALLAYCFIYTLFYYNFILRTDVNDDDHGFSILASSKSVFSILLERYKNWSARLPIDWALFSLINHIEMLRIISALLMLISIIIMAKIGLKDNTEIKNEHITISCLLFLCIPSYIMNDSVWWVTGSFNYLWPLAMFLIGISRFFINYKHKLLDVACIFASGFAMFSEQLALTTIIIFPLLIKIKKNKKKLSIESIQALFIAACLLTQLLSPSNEIRFSAEVLRGFNDYYDKTIFDKISLGTSLVLCYFFDGRNVIFSILLAMLSLLLYEKRNKPNLMLSLCTLAMSILVFTGILNTSQLLPDNAFDYINIYKIIISLLILSFVCIVLFFAAEENGVRASFVFMLSILIVTILGYSPTSYVERPRVFYFSAVSCIYIGILLYNSFNSLTSRIISFLMIAVFFISDM